MNDDSINKNKFVYLMLNQIRFQNNRNINYKYQSMSDSNIKEYIQKIIEPLYGKIQQLEKQNNQLKKRVSCLQTYYMTQSSKSYMKNTASRENQMEGSKIVRRDDDNRSVSGSKEKPGWKSITKLQQPKLISKQPIHHQKIRLKPPIPRMSSKTPTKGNQQTNREKSPPIDRKIVGGKKIEAEKKQIFAQNRQHNQQVQNIVSPRNSNQSSKDFDDPSASRVSKTSGIKLGKPNIYIQKESKLNSVANTPRQTPLERSSVTQKPVSNCSDVTQQNSSPKLTKSQLSINSEKKAVKIEIPN